MSQQNTEIRAPNAALCGTPSLYDQDTLRHQWLRTASIEISTHDISHTGAAAKFLPAGTEVLIPWLPDSTPKEMLRAAATLRDAGLTPVPHLAARRLETMERQNRSLRHW